MKHTYLWVIQTKTPEPTWFSRKQILFSAERTAPANKRHLTPIHYRIKFFPKKAKAEAFYYKKVRAGVQMQNCRIARRKVFLKKGEYDYWKNSYHFRSDW